MAGRHSSLIAGSLADDLGKALVHVGRQPDLLQALAKVAAKQDTSNVVSLLK